GGIGDSSHRHAKRRTPSVAPGNGRIENSLSMSLPSLRRERVAGSHVHNAFSFGVGLYSAKTNGPASSKVSSSAQTLAVLDAPLVLTMSDGRVRRSASTGPLS